MSLVQEGEKTEDKFWDNQKHLIDSANKHISKCEIAAVLTGFAVAGGVLVAGPGGGIIVGILGGTEAFLHQYRAAIIDLKRHAQNIEKREISLRSSVPSSR